MNKADIERIIAEQGLTAYFNARSTVRGNGTEINYLYVYAIEGRGKQRKRYGLGAFEQVSMMSEAYLAELVRTKVNKEKESGHSGH